MSEKVSLHGQIQRNKAKSILLIGVILVFFILLGYVISMALDPSWFFVIMIASTIFSLGYVLVGYYKSDKLALSSVKAKRASRDEHGVLYSVVDEVAESSGLPMPKVYVMESDEINAFASGRDPKNSVICFTTGSLRKLDREELKGVVAHEMSHIANYDIRFMTLAAVLIGMVSILAQMFLRSLWFSGGNDRDGREQATMIAIGILFAILAPIAAQLVSFAISRKREFAADASGAKFAHQSRGLASALSKIKNEHVSSLAREKKVSKAMAPLFISDPFKRKVKGLFSTHPDVDERIKRLEGME